MLTTQLDSTVRDASLASDDSAHVISGTAVGIDDVTRGAGTGGRKVWTEAELRAAADTLVGEPVKALHSETAVGEVTDAGFVEGRGVVYEAKLYDSEIADSIQNGRLTVSIEAQHIDGGEAETPHGAAMVASDIRFNGVAIVQRGASPSATAEPGEAAALAVGLDAMLESDGSASTDGDASDIDISDSTETALKNKRDEHNEAVDDAGKEVTLEMLMKVYRRGAGAWFSSNAGASQNQWAMARVNEALSDIKSGEPINNGHDNDLAPDGYDAPDGEAQNAAQLVEFNGTEVDIEPPDRVVNAVEAAFEAKDGYADDLGDCGTGVGEEMGAAIRDGDLTPEILVSGGDIARNAPATYLSSHGDEGPATDDPPTEWGREEWLGIVNGGSPRCGPVQLGLWGYYQDWFESTKADIEDAMEDGEMADPDDGAPVPENVLFDNPDEAVEKAEDLGFGGEGVAADEMIHTSGDGEDTVFMPGPSHEALVERLRERGELAGMNVGPIEFTGTKEGTLEESELPDDKEGRTGHYLNPGETDDTSSYPLVDADGNLRRGNLNSAWTLRGSGDLGMPRRVAERVLLNLGLVFGPEDSDANPFPEDAYQQAREKDMQIGTPHAAESMSPAVARAASRTGSAMGTAVAAVGQADDPDEGEDSGRGAETDTNDMTNDIYEDAILGSNLAEALTGKMQELMSNSEMSRADLVAAAAEETNREPSTVNAIIRGDTECPPMDVLEGFAEALGVDAEMLVEAAGRDGCEYGEMPGHSGGSSEDGDSDENEEEAASAATMNNDDDTTTQSMSDTEETEEEEELRAELSEKEDEVAELKNRVETLENERETVAQEYAEALAAHSEVLDADDYVERFDVGELAERYDGLEAASLADEPTVRGGDGDGGGTESANLSAAEAERVESLEAKREKWAGRDSRLAENQVEQIDAELAELRGDDE